MSDNDDKTQPAFQPDVGKMVNHYLILAKLGAGGMGEVYLAEDAKLSRSVALKFLPPSLATDSTIRARFAREAKAAASLHHPNIVHVYEVGEHEGRPYIAMEHVDGSPLRKVLSEGPVALETAIAYAEALAGAVEEAHRAGVIHRDIKPGNIVVDSNDRPKLLDFGLAALPRAEAITKTGTTLGTVGYMAPEQARGDSVDQRSDLFSLGVVLYEMIAGHQPFQADTEVATLDLVLHRVQDPLARYRAGVPIGLEQIVSKLLEKDPALRYQTAADLAADIRRERKVQDGSIQASALDIPRKNDRPGWLTPAIIAGTLVVAGLLWKPWNRGPVIVAPAEASQSRLVIFDFENLVRDEGSKNLGMIISSLLVADLSESHFLQVISRQRIFDVAKSLGHDSTLPIDGGLSEAVARKAGGQWMLTGTILQTEPVLVLTSQVADVASGNVSTSQRVVGKPSEDIFAVVDRLTSELKRDLDLPDDSEHEPDPRVSEITTDSPEAYRHFVLGVDKLQQFSKIEAFEELTRAVEIDSTFASAYYMLSVLRLTEQRDKDALIYIQAALRHIDRTTWRERLEIQALDFELHGELNAATAKLREITDRLPDDPTAWFKLGMAHESNSLKALEAYERAIIADSSHAPAYNQLAYAYQKVGRWDDAIQAINRYIDLRPNEPNPRDSRGDLYALQGRLEEARASYEKARAIKPDFMPSSRYKLAIVNLLLGDDVEAIRIFRELADGSIDNGGRLGKRGLIEVLLYQGRYQAALQRLQTEIAHAEARGDYDMWAFLTQYSAFAYSILEQHKDALHAIRSAIAIASDHETHDFHWMYEAAIWVSLRAGRVDLADDHVETLRELALLTRSTEEHYLGARGALAEAHGDFGEMARFYRLCVDQQKDLYWFYRLGKASRLVGRLDEAVEWLVMARDYVDMDRLSLFPFSILVYYELGLAYEASGWNEKAIDSFETFLQIWQNADYRPPEMNDAEQQLTKLRSDS